MHSACYNVHVQILYLQTCSLSMINLHLVQVLKGHQKVVSEQNPNNRAFENSRIHHCRMVTWHSEGMPEIHRCLLAIFHHQNALFTGKTDEEITVMEISGKSGCGT